MIISTKIELNDYLKLVYSVTFRKPLMIAMFILLFFALIFDIVIFTAAVFPEQYDVHLSLPFIIYVAVIALFTYVNGRRNFLSNKKIQETVVYEFSNGKMTAKGESFVSEIELNTSYRIEETSKWFMIFQSRMVANLIPKKDMTEDEIIALRNIFKSVSGIKLKLKS